MKRGTKLIVSLVLVGMLLAVTGTAWSQEPVERETLRGKVVAIEGNALLVNTASGEERRVIFGEETRLFFPGVPEPSIEDIEVGHYVGAWGERNEDGDLLARVVVVVPAALARRGYAVQGHVAGIDGRALTVETPRGERMVITEEETRFIMPGVEEPTMEDVQVGDPLLALGRPDEEGNLVARVVAVVTPGQVRRHTIRGVITALEGDTIGLLTGRGDVRVLTDDETVFRIPLVEDPGIDDLNVRDLVLAVGTWHAEDGVFSARAVALIPRWPSHLRFLRGEVTGIEGRTIVLDALHGELAVLTDGDTQFRFAGVEDPGLDDLRVGDKVGVLVARTEEGGLLAKVVLVRRADESLSETLRAPVEAATTLLESFAQQAGIN
jgi:hypothetical protein